MKDEIVYIILIYTGKRKGILYIFRDITDRKAKNIGPIHIAIFISTDISILINYFFLECLRGAWISVSARIHFNERLSGSIGIKRKITFPEGILLSYQGCNPAVPKKKGRRTIFGMINFGAGFPIQEEHIFETLLLHKRVGYRQAIHKTGTTKIQVKCHGIFRQSQPVLQEIGRA